MKVKDHYDNHLGNFYSWMTGNFTEKQQEQEKYFRQNHIVPGASALAIDLGAGHGLQSVSLARLGFSVTAVDFNRSLLDELSASKGALDIEVIEDELLAHLRTLSTKAGVIVCMGDTLTHLEDEAQVQELIREISNHLESGGKVILSFRDLTQELEGEQRFIPVKSDDTRILTCFLEYFADHVMVHDILHQKQDGKWVQKISAYPKLRLNERMVTEWLREHGIKVINTQVINRMIYLIGEK